MGDGDEYRARFRFVDLVALLAQNISPAQQMSRGLKEKAKKTDLRISEKQYL